jgi:hypothetical protein
MIGLTVAVPIILVLAAFHAKPSVKNSGGSVASPHGKLNSPPVAQRAPRRARIAARPNLKDWQQEKRAAAMRQHWPRR